MLDRVADADDLLAVRDVGLEVQAEVDHVGTVRSGELDTPPDVAPLADLVAVKDADRHHLGAVGDASEAEPVVGGLRDRAGDVRPVTLAVEWQSIAVHEVLGVDEAPGFWQVGVATEVMTLVPVCDTRVKDGDRDALAAGMAVRDQAAASCSAFRCRRSTYERGQEVPLVPRPVSAPDRPRSLGQNLAAWTR